MPALRFVTEVVTGKTRILLTQDHYPLAKEISAQLQTHPSLISYLDSNLADALVTQPIFDVVVHFIGLGEPSLSETLSHTTNLHKLLDYCYQNHSKLILVLSAKTSHLSQAALTLLSQYVKNYPLSYVVLEINTDADIVQTAQAIIRQFVYHHTVSSSRPSTTLIPAPNLKTTHQTTTSSKPKFSKSRFSFFSFFLLLFTAVIIFSLPLGLTSFALRCVATSYSSQQIAQSQICSRMGLVSSQVLIYQEKLLPGYSIFLSKVGFPGQPTYQWFTQYNDSSKLVAKLNSTFASVSRNLFDESSSYEFDTQAVLYLLSTLNESLAALQADTRTLYLSSSTPPKSLNSFAFSLSQYRSLINSYRGIVPDIPLLLGYSSPQKIAFAIQDSNEIRPNGGVISTLILATLDQGKITQTQIVSSHSLNQQLKGMVEAPPNFQTQTQEKYWTIKDAAWSANFPSSASQISWFLDKNISLPADIVVVTNLNQFTSSLNILNSLRINPSNTRITKSNFSTNYLSSISLSDDSSWLTSVISAYYAQLKHLKDEQYLQLALNFISGLEDRQIFISHVSSYTPSLKEIGWDGEVSLPNCGTGQCLSDLIYIVDSNVGKNKSDLQIVRDRKAFVELSENSESYELTLKYSHTGTSSDWPVGEYRNFIRVYLPPQTEISSIEINQQSIASTEYTFSSEHGVSELGIPLVIRPSEEKTLKISAHRPNPYNTNFTYRLLSPNQSGVGQLTQDISISYPKTWVAKVYLPPTIASPGYLRYNTEIPLPQKVEVDFKYD